jgi:hypothetical protein
MESDRSICNQTNYTHDSALTERFVVKITVEKCDKMKAAVSQIFDRVKSVAGLHFVALFNSNFDNKTLCESGVMCIISLVAY